MNHLLEAMAINNAHVELLRAKGQDDNDAAAASVVSETAIRLLQQAVMRLRSFHEIVAGSSNALPLRRDTTAQCFCFNTTRQTEPPNCNDTSILYLYNQPIHLSSAALPDNPCPKELDSSLFHISIAILFNMALASHQYSRQKGTSSAPMYYASQLYDTVLAVLDSVPTPLLSPSLSTLRCLALNNRASIHYDCCEYDDCMLCLDEMCDVLMDCHDDCYCSLERHIGTEPAAEVKRNIIYLQPPTAACCA